jgi:hypothetical protein
VGIAPLTALIVIAAHMAWILLSVTTGSGADNSLLMLEHASRDGLLATRDSHREIRRAALDEQSAPG